MSEQAGAAKRTVDSLRDMARDPATAQAVKNALAKINEAIKKDGSKREGPTQTVNMAALARHLHYLALARGEKARTGTTKHLSASWTSLVKEYNEEFLPRAGKELELQTITDDELMGLCGFDTRRQGSRKKNFYSGLALFLVDLDDEHKLDLEFMKFAVPASEQAYVEQLRRLFALTTPGRSVLPEEPDDLESYPEVAVKFSYIRSKFAELEAFHEHFSVADDACAHFICYRPRKRAPLELMKTFLALKPPSAREFPFNADSSSFNFVHVYKHAPNLKGGRISLGKVIPLDAGLYMVGGQRSMGRAKAPQPFKTLKVIALEWAAVDRADPVIPGLVMSANNDAEHIVSRIALRATPIWKSDQLELGPVKLSDLAQSIDGDMRIERNLLKEKTAPADEFEKYEHARADSDRRSIEGIVGRILDFTNNDTFWDLPPQYQIMEGAKPTESPSLSTASLRGDLEELYGNSNYPKYQDKQGEPFDFWKSIRFGPVFKR